MLIKLLRVKILDTHNQTGCYIDKICDVAKRKYSFENAATKSYPYFSVRAVKYVNIDKEDSIASIIAEKFQSWQRQASRYLPTQS